MSFPDKYPNMEDAKRKVAKFRKDMPQAEKLSANFRRLFTLAKQAPFASAQSDFLDLMDNEIRKMENDIELMKMAIEICDSMDEGANGKT